VRPVETSILCENFQDFTQMFRSVTAYLSGLARHAHALTKLVPKSLDSQFVVRVVELEFCRFSNGLFHVNNMLADLPAHLPPGFPLVAEHRLIKLFDPLIHRCLP
jgi:hypothetical protein